MPESEPITLGEVGRRLGELTVEVKGLSDALGERPSWRDIQRVENGLLDKVGTVAADLAKVQSWHVWIGRLVGGGLAAAALAALLRTTHL